MFPAVHAQYTLHDEVHSLRVVTLMGELLGQTVHSLNTVEIALLILSAYYHDQGMIVDADELAAIRKSDAWHLHEAQWAADHPNRTELLGHLADPLLGDAQREQAALAIADLHAAMFTAFIRPRHGERSAAFVRARLGQDPRLITNGRSIADLLAR
ncbi:MAG TPA: hypothetical protein VK399_02275, partial [Longimicrobiaceae bacterium]|nr:hypothetical protein [Longimicrobiaceae bacterium]